MVIRQLSELLSPDAIISLDTGATKRVSDADYKVLYSAGYLLTTQNGSLFAQAFDTTRLQVSGEARRLPDRVAYSYNASRETAMEASANGLVYTSPLTTGEQLTWFDRTGHRLGTVGPSQVFARPSLSHDGTRIAMEIRDEQSGNAAIWVYDIARGSRGAPLARQCACAR